MSLFFAIVLTIWTAMHAYVVARAWPLLASRVPLPAVLGVAVFLWASLPIGMRIDYAGAFWAGRALAWLGQQWLGVLFLLVVATLFADLVTGFGWLLPRAALPLRAAMLIAAGVLAVIAFAQASRAPVVREQEVRLRGLPRALDGTKLVLVSDLHLGSMLGRAWLEERVRQVEALQPDVIVVGGDLLDGSAARIRPLVPALRGLRAPMGVFAVTGNHEYYAADRFPGADERDPIKVLEPIFADAGMTLLRDTSRPLADGLVIAGIDDLTARAQFHDPHTDTAIATALSGNGGGATIYVSHTPKRWQEAAARGAGLMLCGHTHDGQIWPFRYFVKLQYPLIAGRYDLDGLTVIVGRGTGTWGPRMRLWYPSELYRITLRAA